MNRSRDKVRCALNHQNAGSIPVDFGSTAVTGIHCRIVEALRNYYGLAPRPVKIVDAFQMLGEIDAELAEKIGVDCIGIGGPRYLRFGYDSYARTDDPLGATGVGA